MRCRIELKQLLAVLTIWVVSSFAVAAASAEAQPRGWAYELPNYLMSPFCPGRTIADCSSPQAESLRLWIIVQEAAGRTSDEVEQELIERYGDVIRPAPKPDGFGAAAYVFPVVVFLGGGAFVAFFLRRQIQSRAHPPAAERALTEPEVFDPELERLIDEELAS